MTVPHPIITLPSYFLRKLATWSRQPGVVSVNSIMSKPPSMAACMAGAHCSALGVRRTAQALYFAKVSITFCDDAGVCLYAPEVRVLKPRDILSAIIAREIGLPALFDHRRLKANIDGPLRPRIRIQIAFRAYELG